MNIMKLLINELKIGKLNCVMYMKNKKSEKFYIETSRAYAVTVTLLEARAWP